MSLFDIFKDKTSVGRETAKIKTIAYHEIPLEDFVLYEYNWSGKAEHGSQWIQLSENHLLCEITYHDVHFNDYASPALKTHNTKKYVVDLEMIFNSSYNEIISRISNEFKLSLGLDNCSDENDFNKFIEKIKSIENGQLTETIFWELKNESLTIFGEGKLTKYSYLPISVPKRVGTHCCEYDTVYVLPWAVSKEIRICGIVGESTSVNDIPNKTKIKKLVVDGNIDGIEDYILGANNPFDFNLQPVDEYFKK